MAEPMTVTLTAEQWDIVRDAAEATAKHLITWGCKCSDTKCQENQAKAQAIRKVIHDVEGKGR